MYRYETHLHTWPVSKCGLASVEENVAFYAANGYHGIFITNHFIDGNINCDRTAPYEEQIAFFFSDYEKALPLGEKYGIKIFCGAELSYLGTHFLVYGLDKQWYLEHPEILQMEQTDKLQLMMESGALVIHAHPFLEANYINHIRLFPRHVHGVEVINAPKSDAQDAMARLYAQHYNLIEFAGSDNHFAGNQKKFAGVCFEEPVIDVQDFVTKVKAGKHQLFQWNQE